MTEPQVPTNATPVKPGSWSGMAFKLVVLIAAVGLIAWLKLSNPGGGESGNWISALSSRNVATRLEAVRELSVPATDAKRAIPPLVKVVRADSDPEVRAEAARALGVLWTESTMNHIEGAPRQEALDAIYEAFVDKDSQVRTAAFGMMTNVGGVSGVGKDDPDDRSGMGDPDKFVSRMATALDDPDSSVRAAAGISLASFPANIDQAIPALIKAAATDPDAIIAPNRGRPGMALSRGKPTKKAVPGLIETLKSTDPTIRYLAAQVLGKIGPDAAEAVPALLGLLNDPPAKIEREDPARAAAIALGQIAPKSPKADEALSALNELKKSDNPARSKAATKAARQFEKKDETKGEAPAERKAAKKTGPMMVPRGTEAP